MRFTSTLVLAFSALTSFVSAQSTGAPPAPTGSVIGNPNPISYPLGGTLKAGTVINITWNPTSGSPVSLILRQGEENNLGEVGTIASGIPNSGSFSWAIPKDIVAGKAYSIQIVSGKDSNYSPLFGIDSTVTSSSSSSSVSSTKSQTTTSSRSSTSSSTSSSSSTSPSSTSSTTPTTTPSSNSSTTTTHTSTKPTTPTNSTTTTTTAPAVSNINAGTNLVSSLPLIFCIIAGLVYLN